MTENFKPSNKARYWLHILYPENMRDDWQVCIGDLLEVPYAYCVHDKDKSGHDGDRKVHVHLITAWENGSQTSKRAWETVEALALPGRVCSLVPRASGKIDHSYEYLIHNTESAKKAGKHLYSLDERITGNGFDIERYIVLDSDEKEKMARELCDFAVDGEYRNMARFYVDMQRKFPEKYFTIYKANSAMIDRIIRGNYFEYLEKKDEKEKAKKPRCCLCRSEDVLRMPDGSLAEFESVDGKMYVCKECYETVAALWMEKGR